MHMVQQHYHYDNHEMQMMKFRMPLPRQMKHNTTSLNNNLPPKCNNNNNSFLESNVPKNMRWNNDITKSNDNNASHQNNNDDLLLQEQQKQKHHWLNKETSCEIELDIDVSHILNINDTIISSSSSSCDD